MSHCEAENAELACDLAVVGSGKKGDFLVFEQLEARPSSHLQSWRLLGKQVNPEPRGEHKAGSGSVSQAGTPALPSPGLSWSIS